MNLYEEIEKIKEQGFSEADAQSKLGQDIVLKAISDSGMARNATIKGGVVMRSISGDSRRATQDLSVIHSYRIFSLNHYPNSISAACSNSLLSCVSSYPLSLSSIPFTTS